MANNDDVLPPPLLRYFRSAAGRPAEVSHAVPGAIWVSESAGQLFPPSLPLVFVRTFTRVQTNLPARPRPPGKNHM